MKFDELYESLMVTNEGIWNKAARFLRGKAVRAGGGGGGKKTAKEIADAKKDAAAAEIRRNKREGEAVYKPSGDPYDVASADELRNYQAAQRDQARRSSGKIDPPLKFADQPLSPGQPVNPELKPIKKVPIKEGLFSKAVKLFSKAGHVGGGGGTGWKSTKYAEELLRKQELKKGLLKKGSMPIADVEEVKLTPAQRQARKDLLRRHELAKQKSSVSHRDVKFKDEPPRPVTKYKEPGMSGRPTNPATYGITGTPN